MLSPEVWHFRQPSSSFKQEINDLNETNCSNVINSLSCNHLVTAVLPDTLRVPEELATALVHDCEYYAVEGVPVNELVDRQFLGGFLKKGKLTALSLDTRIDCEDCVLVTPEGVLVLSLLKDTYQRLGVEGKVSRYHKKTRAKYIVKVDLKNCKPDKFYERIKQQFSLIKTTLLMKWHPDDDKICPSSLAQYFHQRGFRVKECSNQFTSHIQYSVKVPHVNFNDLDAMEGEELVEWLGMLSLGCDLENEGCDDFINSYQTPQPNSVIGQVNVLQWRGFFSVEELKRFFDQMRNYVQEEHKMWVALYVQGFSDCPLAWRASEHQYFTNGDSGYVMVLKENKYLLYKQTY